MRRPGHGHGSLRSSYGRDAGLAVCWDLTLLRVLTPCSWLWCKWYRACDDKDVALVLERVVSSQAQIWKVAARESEATDVLGGKRERRLNFEKGDGSFARGQRRRVQ